KVVGINEDSRGHYLIARLAQWEFEKKDTFRFAYTPMPKEDRDMRIIFEALIKTLDTGKQWEVSKKEVFYTEDTFFRHLKRENFQPTETEDGTPPLLTGIIADPTQWTSEMVRRGTTRLVYLEQQAEKIYRAREPDSEIRDQSDTVLMGLMAHSLQTATYAYPDFTFAPSTAPEGWLWRKVIPYELAFDFAQRGTHFAWEPTWTLKNNDLVRIRASVGLVGGLLETNSENTRENFGALGLGYSFQMRSSAVSSWGITTSWYHKWSPPDVGKQDTAGIEAHLSFFENRLRVGLGTRQFDGNSDDFFLTFGLADLPGLIYWVTR
ncbi:MAG: hypothetical protein ACC707_10805, partial [Thiohalomonadales bacterium]